MYYIGSTVGYASSDETTNNKHCYWTSDVGCDNVYEGGNPSVDSETKLVSLKTTTISNLNNYNSSWNNGF